MTNVNVNEDKYNVSVSEGVTTVVTVSSPNPLGFINDGDKGDITVSNNRTAFTINNNAVTSAKILDGTIVNTDINDSAAIANSKLADSGVSAGSFGSGSAIPTITVNDKGIVTAISTNSVNTTTNLSTSTSTTDVTISSSTGNNASISEASGSAAGVMSVAQHDKLDGIESNATADQTKSDIDALGIAASTATTLQTSRTIAGTSFNGSANIDISYTNLTNKLSVGDGGLTQNNFTDALKTKLDGVETGATGDQTSSEIVALVADQTIAPSEINMEDNEKIKLGTGDDLQLFHDQSNSVIKDAGTGMLKILGSTISIKNAGDNKNSAVFSPNGVCNFFNNGDSKLRTSSSGIDVTGDITCSGHVDLPDGSDIKLGDNDEFRMYHDTSNSFNYIQSHNNAPLIFQSSSHTLAQFNPSGAASLRHNNLTRFETTLTGCLIKGATGSDPTLELRHSDIGVEGEVLRFARTDSTSVRYHSITSSSSTNTADNFIFFKIHDRGGDPFTGQNTQLLIYSDKVQARYDGANRFETTDDGVKVIGDVDLSGHLNVDNQLSIYYDNGSIVIGSDGSPIKIISGTNEKLTLRAGSSIETEGSILPDDDNTDALGSSTKRFTTLHSAALNTGDINMSNLNDSANEVDGTKGSWTLQEGSKDLFLINRVNGKKYKFNLTEIN